MYAYCVLRAVTDSVYQEFIGVFATKLRAEAFIREQEDRDKSFTIFKSPVNQPHTRESTEALVVI